VVVTVTTTFKSGGDKSPSSHTKLRLCEGPRRENHLNSLKVLEGKYPLGSTDPRESEIRAPPRLTIAVKLSYYLFIIAKLFKVKDGCLKFVYIGKKFPVYGVFGQ